MKILQLILLLLTIQLNVVFAQFSPIVELSNLNGNNGFVISGNAADDFGIASPIGDINADGIDDVIIAVPNNDTNGSNRGAVYILFGTNHGFSNIVNFPDLNGINGFVIYGLSDGDHLSNSHRGGDFNNDGINDLLLGAFGTDINGSNSGSSYVVFGTSNGFPAVLDLSNLNGTNGFSINGLNSPDNLGSDVSFISDINNDGIDDIMLGAPSVDSLAKGHCYIIFGSTGPLTGNFDLPSLNGTNGFSITGIKNGDQICSDLNSIGDINGDGITDVSLTSGIVTDINGISFTHNFIIFGRSTGFLSNLDLSLVDGNNGFILNGIDPVVVNNQESSSINRAGDFNHDGIDDFIMSAYFADNNGTDSGSAYIIYGSTQPWPVEFDLTSLNGTNGFIINGISEFDHIGQASKIGDVNNDGIDDIIMSTTGGEASQMIYPVSYVIFGSNQSFSSTFDLTTINGSNGFTIMSMTYQLMALITKPTNAGDINNDGIDDILLGGLGETLNGVENVTGYVVFGRDLLFINGFE